MLTTEGGEGRVGEKSNLCWYGLGKAGIPC